MVYRSRIDKMAKKNWETFKALETACKRVRVESITIEFQYCPEDQPRYLKELNL
jgi:hypothetical protein